MLSFYRHPSFVFLDRTGSSDQRFRNPLGVAVRRNSVVVRRAVDAMPVNCLPAFRWRRAAILKIPRIQIPVDTPRTTTSDGAHRPN